MTITFKPQWLPGNDSFSRGLTWLGGNALSEFKAVDTRVTANAANIATNTAGVATNVTNIAAKPVLYHDIDNAERNITIDANPAWTTLGTVALPVGAVGKTFLVTVFAPIYATEGGDLSLNANLFANTGDDDSGSLGGQTLNCNAGDPTMTFGFQVLYTVTAAINLYWKIQDRDTGGTLDMEIQRAGISCLEVTDGQA